jgi:DNA polymerase sigma
MGTSSDALDGSPTSQCSGDSAGKEGPWGSEKDRQIVLLDISFEAPTNTGLRTSELVRELMGQFPHLTPLALILKQFLADRSLDNANKGGLSSYCQVLLITRYLQHQQHLGQPSSNENLGLLFMDFLYFFGHVFDPRSMCVRIRSGGQYVSRDRGPSIDPLYIEDPFDFENNVGSTCFRIQQIVKAFVDAVSILEKELFEASATDVSKGEESFNLLQKIIPSFVGK